MLAFFHLAVYQPLYNILVFLYNVVPGHDFGIAIILTTIILKTLFIPLSKKQIESQKRLQEMQPKIKEIQQKYKNDKEKQTKELMGFYKANKTNPFSGCLPLVVQLIFLIAIYRILFNISSAGLTVRSEDLYSFVFNPGTVNKLFLGIVDLAKPSIPLAVLAAAAQYIQSKMLMKGKKEEKKEAAGGPNFTEIMNKQMLYLGPFLTLFIGIKFAAGLALYWLVSTLFMILQQVYIIKKESKKL